MTSPAAQARGADLQVLPCGPRDRALQARLFNRCFKKRLEAPDLAWRYDGSPHGQAISLLARPQGGEGVSGYACSPRLALPGRAEERAATVGQTGDVMTHPDWRKLGIFSRLDRAAMEEASRRGWPMVFGLPNRRSAHIFLELGWEAVGRIRPWTHVLRAGPGARAVRHTDGRLAELGLPLAAWLGRRARRRLEQGADGAWALQRLEDFPPEVVELSRVEEARHRWMLRRDAAWLRWRFLEAPSGLHEAWGLFERSGRLAGYAVIQRPRPGSALGWIVDLLAEGPAAEAALMAGALGRLEEQGAEAVQANAIDGSAWQKRLRMAGFRPPKAENHLLVIRWVIQADHPLVAGAPRASDWHLTDGDRDDETVG
jgi:GNAT superfamily N-acetyltransferase